MFAIQHSVPKNWLINSFEEIGWLDPENEDYMKYKGPQPMVNNPWEVNSYPDARYIDEAPPTMIYLPSVELIQKMIIASAKNKYGKTV